MYQHSGDLVGKIPSQQVSRLGFEPQQLAMYQCSYLISIPNGPKNNKWASHRPGVWSLARERVGCYYGHA